MCCYFQCHPILLAFTKCSDLLSAQRSPAVLPLSPLGGEHFLLYWDPRTAEWVSLAKQRTLVAVGLSVCRQQRDGLSGASEEMSEGWGWMGDQPAHQLLLWGPQEALQEAGRRLEPLLFPHVILCFSSLKNAEGRGRDNLERQSSKHCRLPESHFHCKMSKSSIHA